MKNRIHLKYHQATFDLLEREPMIDLAALALLEQREAAYGFSFPASAREWYSLAGAVEVLRKHSNQDNVLTLGELQEVAQDRQSYHGWRDYHGLNVLPCIDENQSVALWAIHLNGSDDPPVLVIDDDDEWKPWADHFSTFITSWVWNFLYVGEECLLRAKDQLLASDDLAYLRKTFVEVPRSSHSPFYHFRLDEKTQIHIRTYDNEKTFWWLRANSKESLLEVTKLVWKCGTLASTLSINGGSLNGCAQKVLDVLRLGYERPVPRRRDKR